MPRCSWEQASLHQNILAILIQVNTFPVWVPGRSGHSLSAIFLSIFHRYAPVFWRMFEKESLLEGRLVGELSGFLSIYFILELTSSWKVFHFNKQAFFQWKTFCQNIFVFFSLPLCPDEKIWLLRLSQICCFPLQARWWGCSFLISPLWQCLQGATLKNVVFFLLIFLCHLPLHNTTRILATARVVLYPVAMFMCFYVREQGLEMMFV